MLPVWGERDELGKAKAGIASGGTRLMAGRPSDLAGAYVTLPVAEAFVQDRAGSEPAARRLVTTKIWGWRAR
jgi:hypothetical protein